MILCTSNLEEAIDEAFLDRADLKLYVGNPGPRARYDILSSCIQELGRVGLITDATRLAATAHAPPAGAPHRPAARVKNGSTTPPTTR